MSTKREEAGLKTPNVEDSAVDDKCVADIQDSEDSNQNETESLQRGSDSTSNKSDNESDVSLDFSQWDYIPDPSVNENSPSYYANQQSQPCCCIRGVSYTPPGWKRKYRKRTKSEGSDSEKKAAKKLKI